MESDAQITEVSQMEIVVEPRENSNPTDQFTVEYNERKIIQEVNKETFIQEFNEKKLNQEVNEENFIQEVNKEKLIQEFNKEKLTHEFSEEKIGPEFNEEKLTTEYTEEKLTLECNKEKLIPECNEEKITSKCNEEKFTPEVSEEKLITEHNKEKLIPEIIEKKLTPDITDENLIPQFSEASLISEISKEKLTPAFNVDKLTPEFNTKILTPESNVEKVNSEFNAEIFTGEFNIDKTTSEFNIEKIDSETKQKKSAQESNEEKFSHDSMDMDVTTSDETQVQDEEEKENPHAIDVTDDDLRQFDVLDDLDHTNQDASDSDGCSNDSMDSDIPDDEIEAMLEEGLPDDYKGKRLGKPNDMLYEEKEKLVLDEIGHNHFDVLPEGWVQVTHNSGMPLYLHKQSRVCTLSKPYFLGPGSVRKHEVPVSAIPCLQYKRALKEEEEEKQRDRERMQAAQVCSLPNAKIETIQENRVNQSLDGENLRNYCQTLFRFKSIKVMRFKSWSQRRKFTKNKKQRKQLERPTLPDGTKLITFPVGNSTSYSGHTAQEDEPASRPPKHWIMNPSGKSYVCILHEYVQHALKKQPTYKFKELENAATPYSAVVCINEMEYGSGFGSSKKQAKANAAKKTLEILIPQMRDKISGDSTVDSTASSSSQALKASKVNSDADLSFFDEISINDPRVAEFCAKTTEPLPHAILITCLQRNFGLGDMHINYSVNTLKHQRNEFTMRVGKHEATVICRNKKDGKQRAAQAILQLLHPHIHSWGSLLRLYGSRSVKSFKEKKQLEQEITLLQGRAAVNQPNHAILEKLRQEMRKLSDQRQAVKPIGKFISSDLPTGSSSNLDNVDL